MRQDANRVKEAWRNQEGMSLMETVIVAMIIAIVVAIALPVASRAISSYKTSIAASHIAERLSAARQLAMSENNNISFSFNAGSGQYGFDFTSPPDGVPDTQDPAHPDLSYYVESLPSGTALSLPNNSNLIITFNSRGEMPIGTVIPVGAQGIKVGVVGTYNTASVWVNLRGKVWVTTP
jgi:Tfp pilus assembly protein FimT